MAGGDWLAGHPLPRYFGTGSGGKAGAGQENHYWSSTSSFYQLATPNPSRPSPQKHPPFPFLPPPSPVDAAWASYFCAEDGFFYGSKETGLWPYGKLPLVPLPRPVFVLPFLSRALFPSLLSGLVPGRFRYARHQKPATRETMQNLLLTTPLVLTTCDTPDESFLLDAIGR